MPSKTNQLARQFLSTFDLDIEHLPSAKIHILGYPAGEQAFEQLRLSFRQHDLHLSDQLEDEPAATLVFLFLADPKDLSSQVSHLTTYTSSEHPIIWILLRERFHPRAKEKIAAIWEPLTNAQYYEFRPTMKIGQEKWLGTRFTVGRQGEQDIHMALTLSPQAQQRRSSLI